MAFGRPGRDQQRSRVYRAEPNSGKRFETMAECEAYVARVTASAWFRKHYGRMTIRCKDGRGRRSACAHDWSNSLSLPKWARCESVILHEIAHLVTKNDPGHGPRYAREMLRLVRHFMGAAAFRELRDSYKANGVRYTLPRKHATRRAAADRGRALLASQSPEQRTRNLLRARLALDTTRLAKLEADLMGEVAWAARHGGDITPLGRTIAAKIDATRGRIAETRAKIERLEPVTTIPADAFEERREAMFAALHADSRRIASHTKGLAYVPE
jgi:putative metallohydrolase (TIGR04338 family)